MVLAVPENGPATLHFPDVLVAGCQGYLAPRLWSIPSLVELYPYLAGNQSHLPRCFTADGRPVFLLDVACPHIYPLGIMPWPSGASLVCECGAVLAAGLVVFPNLPGPEFNEGKAGA